MLTPTRALPPPSSLSSRSSSLYQVDLATTWENQGKVSHHRLIIQQKFPATTCKEPGLFFPKALTKIRAHCNCEKKVVSSSTAMKPLHLSPILLNTSLLWRWSGRPTIFTQTSLAWLPFLKHPTLGPHLCRRNSFSLKTLLPLKSTKSASTLFSNSNNTRAPPNLKIFKPSLRDHLSYAYSFKKDKGGTSSKLSPKHPTKQQLSRSSLLSMSWSPTCTHKESPNSSVFTLATFAYNPFPFSFRLTLYRSFSELKVPRSPLLKARVETSRALNFWANRNHPLTKPFHYGKTRQNLLASKSLTEQSKNLPASFETTLQPKLFSFFFPNF